MLNVLMLVHELKENKGGMTSAMFTRSKIFLNHGIDAKIVTFDYDPEYFEVIKKLKDSRKMDKRIEMVNVYEYFSSESKYNSFDNQNTENHYRNMLKAYTMIPNNTSTARYFDKVSGDYRFYVRFSGESILFVDEFMYSSRKRRMHFKQGKIKFIEYFNHENIKIREILFNDFGVPFISRMINSKSGNISQIFLLTRKIMFKNNLEFSRYFMNEIIDDSTALICDGPGSFPKMLELKNKKTKKYAVIHTNHYKNRSNESGFKVQEEFILKNADEIDGIITLTESQKKDIQMLFGIDNVFVISNFINFYDEFEKNHSDFVVGSISRLDKNKGFDRMIEVAKKVIEMRPEVIFHIYGSGSEKEKIEKMITENNLSKNVYLKGYTNYPREALKTFSIYISTSYFEGQGLSVMEAMEQGIPAVAFDVKYGMSDTIDNGVDGVLIENNEISKMAEAIVKLSDRNDLVTQFGKKARKKIHEEYSERKLMEKWQELF